MLAGRSPQDPVDVHVDEARGQGGDRTERAEGGGDRGKPPRSPLEDLDASRERAPRRWGAAHQLLELGAGRPEVAPEPARQLLPAPEVCEVGAGAVSRYQGFDADTRQVIAQGLAPAGLEQIDGRVYVSDFVAGTISVIFEAGAAVSPPRVIASGLAGPQGLAVVGGDRLAVVEAGPGRVTLVDPVSGATQVVSDELAPAADPIPGLAPTVFVDDVTILPDGDLVVSDPRNNRILRIDLGRFAP